MLKVETFVLNPFSENTYIAFDDISKEACIIDPGCHNRIEENEISNFIEQNNLVIKFLFNTHGHIDHIFGNLYIKNKYNPVFYFPKGELFLLDLMDEQAIEYGVKLNKSPYPDEFFTEDLILMLGDIKLNFISTPGHSPDEYCILCSDSNICFTGDVLFNESIGRTDLWGGNYNTLEKSIRNKLYNLPDNTVIYPGHEDKSTIKHEKRYNPFIKID